MRSKLDDLHCKFKIGILIIEHDIEAVSTLWARVVVLNFGKVIVDGPPDAVFRDSEVIKSCAGNVHA